jgi:hypothetical protein
MTGDYLGEEPLCVHQLRARQRGARNGYGVATNAKPEFATLV